MNRLVSSRCQCLTFHGFSLVVKGQVAHSLMKTVNKTRSTEPVAFWESQTMSFLLASNFLNKPFCSAML